MNTSRKTTYEKLYNITLPEFYSFVIQVIADFNYSLHHTLKEVDGKRRIELWNYSSKEDQKALVWIEVVKPEESIDPYLTTDVLRMMNEENVTTLFFFTNTNISPEDRDVLDGQGHFIFSTEEIAETIIAIESKKIVKTVKKRKEVKVPSGMVIIKNFFKRNEFKKKQVRIKMSATPDLASQYTRLVRKILTEIDKVEDINDIAAPVREKFKRLQFELLPELVKVSSYIFPRQFSELRNSLFNLVQFTIVYLGNFVEYESENELKNNRANIEKLINSIDSIDDEVLAYKADLMFQAEKHSIKLILTAGAICFIAIILLIVVKFSN